MSIKKITAIFDQLQLRKLEDELKAHGITGFTIHPVKGRGDYCNTYSQDQLVKNIQIEIYTSEQHVLTIAKLIMQTVDVGLQSEGLVSISSVDQMFWIHQQTPVNSEEFKYIESNDE
jgi:nitrogen regulatory protein P-II 1